MAKKTRKQKLKTTARRSQHTQIVEAATSGPEKPIFSFPTLGFTPTAPQKINAREQEHQALFVKYFKQDMLKTLVVSLIICGLIAIAWWKFQ